MNRENVQKAIDIMKRAGKVDMRSYQNAGDFWAHMRESYYVTTEEAMHQCGNAACFAGWVAVSPEWKEAGGKVHNGAPMFDKTRYGFNALAEWMGISHGLAYSMVHGDHYCDEQDNLISRYYGKPWTDVTAADVVAKLEALLEEGE